MYKLHLILKYLRKRRIAWVSLIAVMLCTAMVIVVISVMGGWLRMFRNSFHGLSGDIIVSRQSLVGFPYYEQMIERINAIDGVAAAVPTIHTFGLIDVWGQIQLGVEVQGYPIEQMDQVSRFRHSLYRQYQMADDPEASELAKRFSEFIPDVIDANRVLGQQVGKELRDKPATFDKPLPPDFYRSEWLARHPRADLKKVDPAQWPGMIVGVGVVNVHKDPKTQQTQGRDALLEAWAKLTVLGVSDQSANIDFKDATPRNYWLVDDSRTKIWQYDEATVYVPFKVLQQDLKMDAEGDEPARTTDIQIGLKPGADAPAVKQKIQQVVDAVLQEHGVVFGRDTVRVQTWEESKAKFLGAVEKEKILVTFLFGIISIVAIFLIFCIFFMIVVEKTKDIGIIKSVGATSTGVAGIFLGYGLAIGVVGGGLGLLSGYLIVHNINELHTWMGRFMGVQIWSAETYAFDTIPNTMNPPEVAVIVAIAVLASLIGALVPSIRAARMHPIEALRWE